MLFIVDLFFWFFRQGISSIGVWCMCLVRQVVELWICFICLLWVLLLGYLGVGLLRQFWVLVRQMLVIVFFLVVFLMNIYCQFWELELVGVCSVSLRYFISMLCGIGLLKLRCLCIEWVVVRILLMDRLRVMWVGYCWVMSVELI